MIALISGRGDYPKEITSSLKNQKINFIKLNLYQKDKYNVSIGEIGKIIKILKTNNVKEVIFAGKVYRPNLRKIKLDLKAISYLPLIKKAYSKGDGNLLNLVAKILRDENIKIIESHKYSKNLILNNVKMSIDKNLNELCNLSKAEILSRKKEKFLEIGRDKGLTKGVSISNKLTFNLTGINKFKKVLLKYKYYFMGLALIFAISFFLFG